MPGQRLLAQLDLFSEPEVVLDDPKYWNPDFARHFIEAWDGVAYVDPHAGMRLSEVAVKLVGRLDRDAHQVLLPRALATMGSSHRALEDLDTAEAILAEVRAHHARTLVPRLDEADYFRRMTYLRINQQRFAEALACAEKTVTLCRAELADHELGRAYGARGAVYLSMILSHESAPPGEPIHSLSEALRWVDPRKGLHTYEAPTRNLATALLKGYPCDLELTLRTLKKALRLQAKLRVTRRTLPNAQLRWTIGLVYMRTGELDRAAEVLRRARRVLMHLGFARQVAWISLDLAELYARLGHWGRLRILASEIISLEGVYSLEGLAALRAWHHAVLREEVPERVWSRVIDTVRLPLALSQRRQRQQPITFSHPRLRQAPPLW